MTGRLDVLDPFGKEEKKQVLPREMPNRKPRTESRR